jgi:phthalate 4,5-dioxygenase reductase subunit
MSGTAEPTAMMPLRVASRRPLAHDIVLFHLVPEAGADLLPAFDAGAHVVVMTPAGLTRRYSLCNTPGERHRYEIAVKREAQGLGGSRSLVDQVQVGDRLPVGRPENFFPLDAHAQRFLFVAGGIGITPIVAMLRALQGGPRPFELVYCARSPEATAFADELRAPALAPHCRLHHDLGDPARAFDFAPLLAEPAPGTHLYCCGPVPLMQSVRALSRHWPAGTVHFEDFGARPTAAPTPPSKEQAFTVRLARSGLEVPVAAGTSILQALRDRGLPAPSSCESGTCGACRTPVVEGLPEHRDYVLDEDAADEIMICVSRARSPLLVLDL